MGSAVCGGTISHTEFFKQLRAGKEPSLMWIIRKRVKVRGHYRYKLIDQLGDCYWWEEKERTIARNHAARISSGGR